MNFTSIIDGKQNDAVPIYDFQGDLLRRIVEKKIVFFKTLYLSTLAHVSHRFSLSDILRDAEMHQSLVDLLKIFDVVCNHLVITQPFYNQGSSF